MKISNHTNNDLVLRIWEIVNEDDVNVLGEIKIKKNSSVDELLPEGNLDICEE